MFSKLLKPLFFFAIKLCACIKIYMFYSVTLLWQNIFAAWFDVLYLKNIQNSNSKLFVWKELQCLKWYQEDYYLFIYLFFFCLNDVHVTTNKHLQYLN